MTAPVLEEQHAMLITITTDDGEVTSEAVSNQIVGSREMVEDHIEWLLQYRRPYLREAAEHETEEEERTGRITTNQCRYALRQELLRSYSIVRREVTPWERVMSDGYKVTFRTESIDRDRNGPDGVEGEVELLMGESVVSVFIDPVAPSYFNVIIMREPLYDVLYYTGGKVATYVTEAEANTVMRERGDVHRVHHQIVEVER